VAEPGGRRGLGRGLSALLGETDAPPPEGAEAAPALPPREIAIELLRRNPDQPRRYFPDVELDELAASIREKGVLQPLLVRPVLDAPGEYQIVAGERRWRAAQRAGVRALPIVVRDDLTDLDVLEIGIIENVQRADLNALEEALGYKALIDQFGRTQEQVAETVGKSRSHVANTLRMLTLPGAVQLHLVEGRLSAGHARAIASAPNAEQLAEKIVAAGLSVRQAEALAREAVNPASPSPIRPPAPSRGKDPDTRALESDLSEAIGLVVDIDDRNGRGAVTIRYETLEQLDDLCRRLSR
jgi:ParB family transcriptional regulator, chromosome partitioning protein